MYKIDEENKIKDSNRRSVYVLYINLYKVSQGKMKSFYFSLFFLFYFFCISAILLNSMFSV